MELKDSYSVSKNRFLKLQRKLCIHFGTQSLSTTNFSLDEVHRKIYQKRNLFGILPV